MNSNILKKNYNDDKIQLLSIISKKAIDSNNIEDTISALLKSYEQKTPSEFDYETLIDILTLYKKKILPSSDNDFLNDIKLLESLSLKQDNIRDNSLCMIYKDSLRFFSETILSKLKKIWKSFVQSENSQLFLYEKMASLPIKKLDEFMNYLHILNLTNLLHTFYEDHVLDIENKAKIYLIKVESNSECFKIIITDDIVKDESVNFLAISDFLNHRLIIKIKVLLGVKPIKDIPQKDTHINGALSLCDDLLLCIRSEALNDDILVVEEREFLNTLEETIGKKHCLGDFYLFSKMEVHSLVLKIVKVLYKIIEKLINHSGNENEIRDFIPCINSFLALRSAWIYKKVNLKKFCLFVNSCKFLMNNFTYANSFLLQNFANRDICSLTFYSLIDAIQNTIDDVFGHVVKIFQIKCSKNLKKKKDAYLKDPFMVKEDLNKYIKEFDYVWNLIEQPESSVIIDKLLKDVIAQYKKFTESNKIYGLEFDKNLFSDFFKYFPDDSGCCLGNENLYLVNEV